MEREREKDVRKREGRANGTERMKRERDTGETRLTAVGCELLDERYPHLARQSAFPLSPRRPIVAPLVCTRRVYTCRERLA